MENLFKSWRIATTAEGTVPLLILISGHNLLCDYSNINSARKRRQLNLLETDGVIIDLFMRLTNRFLKPENREQ